MARINRLISELITAQVHARVQYTMLVSLAYCATEDDK